MFKILKQVLATGIVTADYPESPMEPCPNFRGRPVVDFQKARDCSSAAQVCPTGALTIQDNLDTRKVTLDYGRCIFCGLCAEASPEGAIRLTSESELAVGNRNSLVFKAYYRLDDESHDIVHRKMYRNTVHISPSDEFESQLTLR